MQMTDWVVFPVKNRAFYPVKLTFEIDLAATHLHCVARRLWWDYAVGCRQIILRCPLVPYLLPYCGRCHPPAGSASHSLFGPGADTTWPLPAVRLAPSGAMLPSAVAATLPQ